ncbi:MAG: formate dehydrogenase accessory protein FdhE [Deltaproteobacteria bacterium]|nr:formate dehydrogenase accessory protein FdhE [Deltaproteobacteria bacterium]
MTRSHDTDPIVRRLRALVQHSPDLKEAARHYEIILPLLRDADLHVAPVSIPPDQARTKMARGLPLLHDIELELDRAAIGGLMLRLATALGNASGNNRSRYLLIGQTLAENRLDMGAFLTHVAADERSEVTSVAQSLQLDPGLLWALAQNALKPAWRTWCRQLTPLADVAQWTHGFCFICGAGAMLGELQENNLVKHLRCGQCGADWPSRRLQCMYCGNEDHHTLGYLYAEPDQEKMRVEVCEKCHGYLKVIVSFSPTPSDLLVASDLATLHLDYIAQERGYARLAVDMLFAS